MGRNGLEKEGMLQLLLQVEECGHGKDQNIKLFSYFFLKDFRVALKRAFGIGVAPRDDSQSTMA